MLVVKIINISRKEIGMKWSRKILKDCEVVVEIVKVMLERWLKFFNRIGE